MSKATDHDHRIINSVSFALHGNIGGEDDVERLMSNIPPNATHTACEIAVAFIRWAQDLKQSVEFYKRRCDALQVEQSNFPEPCRTTVCNILANGKAKP